eukprot:289641-Chlamydomonas_euryale.AAC.1
MRCCGQVTSGVGQDRALVYSQLMRSGYVVVRHPSLWVLPADTFPSDGWREWLAGPGSGDDGRGTAGDGAAGDEGTAAGDEAGCGGDGDCRDGGGGGSGEFGWPRVTSAPSAAHVGGDAAGDGAAGIAGTGGTGGTGVSNAEACRHMRAEGRSAAASGRPPPPAEAAAATACSRPLSRWWAAADASHPHLRGVAQQWFVECTPRHAVEVRRAPRCVGMGVGYEGWVWGVAEVWRWVWHTGALGARVWLVGGTAPHSLPPHSHPEAAKGPAFCPVALPPIGWAHHCGFCTGWTGQA